MNKNYIRNLLLVCIMQLRNIRQQVRDGVNFLRGISNIELGRNVNISKGLRLSGSGKIFLGNNSKIKRNVLLRVSSPGSKIKIGEGVRIEDDVQLICQQSGEINIGGGSILGRGVRIVCYKDAKIVISENVTFQEQSELRTNTLATIGQGSMIGKFTSIAPRDESGSGNFYCGEKCGIHEHNFLDTTESIALGNEVATGPYDIFYTHDHSINRDQSIWDQPIVASSIHIGDGSWIGSQVIILPGVNIGIGAIVAAGSVVTKSVDDFNLVAGVPAKFLKERK